MSTTYRRRRLSEPERDQRRNAERERVKEAAEQLLTSEGWQRWVRARSMFRRYSAHNTMLLALDFHLRGIEPEQVAGFRVWLKLGRSVRKGEHGIRIAARVTPKKAHPGAEQTEPQLDERSMRFTSVSVFGLSQTDPLPGVEQLPLEPPCEPLTGDSHTHLLEPLGKFDRWCWPVCDPASGLGTTGIGEHDYWPVLPRLLLLDQRPSESGALPTLTGPRARPARNRGLRFLDVLGAVGIGDELRVPLRDKHGLWGCLDLMRCSDEQPFTEQDVAFLDGLASLLATATRRSAAAAATGRGESPALLSAGVFVLDSDLAVRASTPGARAWLAQLLPPGLPFAAIAAMAPIYNVASRVLAVAGTSPAPSTQGRDLPARARVRAANGAWAIIEADRLDPLERTVAVTIRPAAAQDVLDLRLIAHDLTARQRELVNALLDGSDTKGISERLFLSPHTVNDHLKAIFDKVGVRSRKELIAVLAAQ